ncbi:MAG TPA: sulfatase-like hydrolase/transferase [Anaeromyxobacteraceae bacterium]|nr:sulfatase-like hydrolase/transferase [Anaeromyxobacteraceae bacterium]
MARDEQPGAPEQPPASGASYRFPALLWALLHVPLFLALFAGGIAAAVRATPEAYRWPLAPAFLVQAVFLAAVGWLLALPLSAFARAYRFAAPAVMGLGAAVVALDARVYRDVGFHLNGFFLEVLLQPNALRETGVSTGDALAFAGLAAGFVAAEIAIGAWFLRRFARPRRVLGWAVAFLLLGAAERAYGATLYFFGGPAVFAASTVLPLQVPFRMHDFLRKVTGRQGMPDHFAGAARESQRLPAGVSPEAIRFTRRDDVLLVVAESLPSEHLDERTMPNLSRRAAGGGALFARHYAGASATNYTVFSIFYGLWAHRLEATVGAGRRPLLFSAMRANGYALRLLASSCVDWMGLKETVFGGVEQDLATWCGNEPTLERDAAMLADARAFVDRTPGDKPLFLFLFFDGTHFGYHRPDSSVLFTPEWDGKGGLKGTSAPGPEIRNRARNAAHALDASLEPFLRHVEARRGRRPIVLFTGDHGEEFREKGHIGHGSDVTREQIHVPLAVLGDGVPRGRFDVPTSHADLVPTIFALLGDRTPPALHSDGLSVFEAPEDRFVVATVGWEPRYAVIGKDLKVNVYAGLAGAAVTDPDDRPLPDGDARLAGSAARILRALRGEDAGADRAGPGRGPEQGPVRAAR